MATKVKETVGVVDLIRPNQMALNYRESLLTRWFKEKEGHFYFDTLPDNKTIDIIKSRNQEVFQHYQGTMHLKPEYEEQLSIDFIVYAVLNGITLKFDNK